MTTKKKDLPLNIGLVLGELDETYHNLIWPNFVKITKNLNINLFLIVGRQLDYSLYDEKEQNIIYNLIDKKIFNGLILFSGSLGHFIDYKELEIFMERFKDIPAVGINENIKGIPSVLMNSKKGEEELLEHLIHEHGYLNFAFIRGPEGHQAAIARYDVFMETLRKYHIPLDNTLVSTPGNFLMNSGESAVKEFLSTDKKIDVIVSANDEMAIGAINELNRNGIKVPDDIAVVGFDNTDEAIFFSPPLTTVKQPYYELCKKAIDLLMRIITGQDIPQNIEVHTKLEIKRSCGCDYPGIKKIKMIKAMQNLSLPVEYSALVENKSQIINETLEMSNISSYLKQQVSDWFEKIIDEITVKMKNKNEMNFLLYSFINFPENIIFDFYDYEILKEILDIFISNCSRYLHNPEDKKALVNMQKIGNILIDETMSQNKALESVHFRKNSKKLQKTSQYFITSLNIEMLTRRLAEELPQIGINSCYIILYESRVVRKSKYDWSIPQNSRLIFALESGKNINLDPNEVRFNTYELLPDKFFKQTENMNMILMPLLYKNEHFGFILFELGSIRNLMYETIRAQISTTIKKVKDHEEDKYSALGMLFGGISHEILNPLGGVFAPLENLKICLEESNINNHDKISTYIDRMENNLLRIENLIKGLRTLYHDRVLIKSEINLLEAVNIAADNIKNALKPLIELKLNIPADTYVMANHQALVIIVQNLLKNANDAIPKSGCIEINYKTKSNFKYLVIKDNGIGIENSRLNDIFNAFYTTKEVGKGTGLGLYLVKDLVLRMNWEINVTSAVNHGSEFILVIK